MPDKSLLVELKRVLAKYGYELMVDDGLVVMRSPVGHPAGDFYRVSFRSK
jgi:hypothetical protein